MSASIVLSDVAWSTPDGRQILSHLDLSFGSERTGLVGRNGAGKTTLLRLISGDLVPQAGAISVNARLAMLRQTVQVDPGETVADLFGAAEGLAILARAEAGLASAGDLEAADWTLASRLVAALVEFGLDCAPATPLNSLSGGQRTRAGLAAMIFDAPDMLLLDEPTNNLDTDGRQAVMRLLANWRAGAIVVSHDRSLLDLMDATVELTSLGATRYGGGWSRYRERKALELAAAQHDLDTAQKTLGDLAHAAQQTAERKQRKDGAGARMAAKGDQPRILLGAQKRRAEETSAANARLAERRREQALDTAAQARDRIEILQPFAVSLPPTGLSTSKEVLKIHDLTTGHDPRQPVIANLSFTLTGPERVAVTGPNGSGKTTLLAVIDGRIPVWSGQVRVMTPHALLDQTVGLLDPVLSIRDNFRRLNPQADENACRAALARFMFRADAALQMAGDLSGGQLLRAGLACVLGAATPPPLLMLDEPTNHLDIESVEAVEAGLRAYDGALLIVSHDEAFLDAVNITRRLDLGSAEPS